MTLDPSLSTEYTAGIIASTVNYILRKINSYNYNKTEDSKMKKSEEIQNEIKKAQEQLKKLQASLDEAKKLEMEVPEKLIIGEGDAYWFVTYTGDIHRTLYTNLASSDVGCVRNRRAFLSEDYAKEFAKKTQFIADLLHFKYLYDRDYEPDWNSEDERKYCVYYNNYNEKFEWGYHNFKLYTESVFFSSEEVAEKCAEWLNTKKN